MSDAPIEPQEFLYGPKVVTIEDLRVARGLTRRPLSSCLHRQLVYDDKERRVWCQDCESEVEAFDAFLQVVGVFSSAKSKIDRRMQEVAEAEKFAMRSRAAKRMDEYWRSQTMAPLCPHCNGAILPEDVVNGLAQTSKSIEIAARKRKQSARPTP
ncbi:hypothetical protein [Stutzerimonas degradans]